MLQKLDFCVDLSTNQGVCLVSRLLFFGISAGSVVSVKPVEVQVECIMSSSGADEVGEEELTQDVREQRIVNRFNYLTIQGGPQRGAVVLRFLGFGVITLVGIDPKEA